jgi:hypothetical protein
MMEHARKPYIVVIYGKDGCEMCARLKSEVSTMLQNENLENEFDLDYQNLSTIEGMIAFASAETINGQRIPALQVMKYSQEKGTYLKIQVPQRKLMKMQSCAGGYLQLQTDYSSTSSAIQMNQVRELISIAQNS